jgi:hypothetical protein
VLPQAQVDAALATAHRHRKTIATSVFTTALLTRLHSAAPRHVTTSTSPDGHLGVYVQGGRIVVRTPVYGPNDANCSPSSQHFVRYT